MADELDDKDEFGPYRITPEDVVQIEKYLSTPPKRGKRTGNRYDRYPQIVAGSLRNDDDGHQIVDIKCGFPDCTNTRTIFTLDLFQVKLCDVHSDWMRQYKRTKRAERMERDAEQVRRMMESKKYDMGVSDTVMEELGGVRPAHLLIKAKHDLSWIEYVDAEGNTKFMQVHDVRSARDAHGRWAIYGVDQDGAPVHELYDLRHGYEHSGSFSGIRELAFGEIVKLAQQGVIKGEGGKPINSLSGLMQIADEPLRKLLMKKAKEAKAGGPSLEDIEKQIFAEPTASSAQKRRTGKAGTRPWQKLMSL